jgi:hypothetical protein
MLWLSLTSGKGLFCYSCSSLGNPQSFLEDDGERRQPQGPCRKLNPNRSAGILSVYWAFSAYFPTWPSSLFHEHVQLEALVLRVCDLRFLLPEITENAPNYTICLLLHKQVFSFVETSVLEQSNFYLIWNHYLYKVYITLTETEETIMMIISSKSQPHEFKFPSWKGHPGGKLQNKFLGVL